MTSAIHGAYAATSAAEARTIQGPTGGLYPQAPGKDEPSAAIDLSDFRNRVFRISALTGHLWYVFVDDVGAEMTGPGNLLGNAGTPDYQTAFSLFVPDIIWCETSDRITVPAKRPILLIRAYGDNPEDYILRRA